MRYRPLGSTQIQVSELGFGVWTLTTGWWGEYSDEAALSVMRRALDLGVTYFDTADTYGKGRGETVVAPLLKSVPRDRIVISSKFGYDWQGGQPREVQREQPQDFSVEFVRSALEGALRRLSTDYIDCWQLHNPRRWALERDDLFTFLDQAKRDGKLRSIGVALGPAIGWLEEGTYALRHRGVEVVQMIYNILEQDPGRDLIRVARQTSAGLLVRVPHSSGMLEGRYDENTTFAPHDHRSFRTKEWLARGLQVVERLRFLTEGRRMTLGQAALRFVLAEREVAAALPNIYNEEQLAEFAAASDCEDLTPEELRRLEALYLSEFRLIGAPGGSS